MGNVEIQATHYFVGSVKDLEGLSQSNNSQCEIMNAMADAIMTAIDREICNEIELYAIVYDVMES